jgi:hypothetical protein
MTALIPNYKPATLFSKNATAKNTKTYKKDSLTVQRNQLFSGCGDIERTALFPENVAVLNTQLWLEGMSQIDEVI